MIDSVYSFLQISHALTAGIIVLAAGASANHRIAVFALIAYWFLGSVLQEIFNTLTPSAYHFVEALGVFFVMSLMAHKSKSRNPFLYIAVMFLGVMLLDASHYAVVWLSDALPVWNRPYMHLSALLFHMSIFAVWFNSIKEKRHEPVRLPAR